MGMIERPILRRMLHRKATKCSEPIAFLKCVTVCLATVKAAKQLLVQVTACALRQCPHQHGHQLRLFAIAVFREQALDVLAGGMDGNLFSLGDITGAQALGQKRGDSRLRWCTVEQRLQSVMIWFQRGVKTEQLRQYAVILSAISNQWRQTDRDTLLAATSKYRLW